MTRQVHDVIDIPILPKMQCVKSFKNVAAYIYKDSFVFSDKINNFSEFDDNLEVLEAYDDEEDDEDSFCLCGKANDDKMIICESEECTGCNHVLVLFSHKSQQMRYH